MSSHSVGHSEFVAHTRVVTRVARSKATERFALNPIQSRMREAFWFVCTHKGYPWVISAKLGIRTTVAVICRRSAFVRYLGGKYFVSVLVECRSAEMPASLVSHS